MNLTNSARGYGWITIVMHWLVAVAVLGLFALGIWMVDLSYYSDWYHDAPFIHKSVGVLLVGLMLFRWVWTLVNPKPAPASVSSRAVAFLISAMHAVLYLLVFLLGVSGYLISTAEGHGISVFDWFTVPALIEPFEDQADLAGEIHELLAFVLIGLVVLHALAALKHHFINRDNTLKRMLKPSGK
ncbi:cytochrome b [Thiomicrorhabdus sp. ZW0627]|uniref:cytochrome b n=1 Tax=Thiomicrorhabdus sp. ZW0627 TaxID=3039774 RepID=UPI002436E182|nr:cytochrome b [Thiomicrorhabdus sp. ZW0627]MDG6774165.1 cytochrome b [Thiomicrorhabdus sp. ZW0627]